MVNVSFKMNNSGIRKVAKSTGMQNALLEAAEELAGDANSDAHAHADWLYKGYYELEPYGTGVTTKRGTAIAYVTTVSSVAFINEKRYKSLSNTNH